MRKNCPTAWHDSGILFDALVSKGGAGGAGGQIDPRRWPAGSQRLQMERVISEIDCNGDNKISRDEWNKYVFRLVAPRCNRERVARADLGDLGAWEHIGEVLHTVLGEGWAFFNHDQPPLALAPPPVLAVPAVATAPSPRTLAAMMDALHHGGPPGGGGAAAAVADAGNAPLPPVDPSPRSQAVIEALIGGGGGGHAQLPPADPALNPLRSICDLLTQPGDENGLYVAAVHGLAVRPNPGAGNCQFFALAEALHGDQNEHQNVREEICLFLEHNNFWRTSVLDPPGADAYLADMQQANTSWVHSPHGNWGDDITLQAAADLYRMRVFVLTEGEPTILMQPRVDPERAERNIMIRLSGPRDDGHYELLSTRGGGGAYGAVTGLLSWIVPSWARGGAAVGTSPVGAGAGQLRNCTTKCAKCTNDLLLPAAACPHCQWQN
jgi:hypothetical protein